MWRCKELIMFVLFLILMVPALAKDYPCTNHGEDSLSDGLSQDEYALIQMINDLRRENKLPSIPLSGELCIVAKTHIADLIRWKPQNKGCSLHSWSGSGKWTSCCYTRESTGIQCMKSKPREITGYEGDGYEIIYLGEDIATPKEVADQWRNTEASADMILCRNKWTAYQWKTMGLGMKDGYAALWFGDLDTKARTALTDGKSSEKQKSPPASTSVPAKPETKAVTASHELQPKSANIAAKQPYQPMEAGMVRPQYYVVTASYREFESANTEMKSIRLKGYPDAFILYHEPMHRVVIASFKEYEKASAMKNELKDVFPGIWVLYQ